MQNFDWMKIVSLMLPADLKNMDSKKKNRHSHYVEKNYQTNFLYTSRYM